MSRGLIIFAFCLCIFESARGDCGVVNKKQWGGLEAAQVQFLPRPVDLVIIQHTATPMCKNDKDCKNRMKNTQDYHMDILGWWDIGASFFVGGNAKVYEGTGWTHVGAHTLGYNSRSIGVSFIGNYESDEPTTQQLDAVQALLRCGVEKGHLASNYHVVGHKQLIATLSPGSNLYSEIRTWPEWIADASSINTTTH